MCGKIAKVIWKLGAGVMFAPSGRPVMQRKASLWGNGKNAGGYAPLQPPNRKPAFCLASFFFGRPAPRPNLG
jgi:hypothetical protein